MVALRIGRGYYSMRLYLIDIDVFTRVSMFVLVQSEEITGMKTIQVV